MIKKKRRRKRKLTSKSLILNSGIAASTLTAGAAAVANRKPLKKAYVKYKTRIAPTKYKSSRERFQVLATGEQFGVRLNNKTRQKAFNELSKKGQIKSNKDINRKIVQERQAQIGGIGTKGRNKAEKELFKKMKEEEYLIILDLV